MTCHPHPIINPHIYNLSHLLTIILKTTIYLHTLSPSPLTKRPDSPIQSNSDRYMQPTSNTKPIVPRHYNHLSAIKKHPPKNNHPQSLGATTPDTYIHTYPSCLHFSKSPLHYAKLRPITAPPSALYKDKYQIPNLVTSSRAAQME